MTRRSNLGLGIASGITLSMFAVMGAGVTIAQRDDMKPAIDRVMALADPTVVVDGDTLKRGAISIRLMGFDAPETFQAKCPEERELGMRAKARMQELIEAGDWNLYRVKNRDRYGRDLAVMKVKGRDVAEIMISEGLAREYHGKGKRRGWCGEDIRP